MTPILPPTMETMSKHTLLNMSNADMINPV